MSLLAVDRQHVALAEQHVGRAAVAATQFGDAVFGLPGELGFETAAQIGLPRGQRQQRVAALLAVGEAEAAFANARVEGSGGAPGWLITTVSSRNAICCRSAVFQAPTNGLAGGSAAGPAQAAGKRAARARVSAGATPRDPFRL